MDFLNIDDLSKFANIKKLLDKVDLEEYDTALGELYRAFGGKFLGEGTTRCVYRFSPTEVIKIPKADHDSDNPFHTYMNNIMEYLFYSRLHTAFPLAPCRLVFYKCVPLIIMEEVEVLDDGDELEFEWIENNGDSPLADLHDGFQIGYLNGRVVCYDYGYEGGIYGTLCGDDPDLTEDEAARLSTFTPKITGMDMDKIIRARLIKALLGLKAEAV
jgi:hypothetical protein